MFAFIVLDVVIVATLVMWWNKDISKRAAM